MAANSFITFSGVTPGESFQASHPGQGGWTPIDDWSWDIEAETSHLKGGGSAVGKPTPGTLNFTHFFSRCSPVILDKIVTGTYFDRVTIEMLKQTGAGAPQTYFQICMQQVFMSKVSVKAGEDGNVTQEVDMVFKQVSVNYKQQGNKTGKLDTPAKIFNWNIPLMSTAIDPVKGKPDALA